METVMIGIMLTLGAIAVLGMVAACVITAKILLKIAEMVDDLENRQ